MKSESKSERDWYSRRVYVPSVSEQYERPQQMQILEPGVYVWKEKS